MKETTCQLCGGRIGVGDETAYGQHVLCPYCGGKFSYLAENAGLPPEHLSEPPSHGHAPKKKRGNSGLLLVAACFLAVLIMGSILAILLLPSIIDSFAKPHQTPVHCVIELPTKPVRGNDVQEMRSAVYEMPVPKEVPVSNVVVRPVSVENPKMETEPEVPQAEETKQAEVPRIDDRHEIALNAFAGRTLLFWEDLRDRERPNVSAETWYCAVADGTKTFALYAMEGASMGVSNRILRLVRGKQPQEVSEGDFRRVCKDAVVVYANGESAVIRGCGAQKSVPFAIPKDNEPLSVGALVFGDVLPFLEGLGVDMSETEYAASVTVRRSEIEVSQLGVADRIEREAIEKAVREHLLKNKIDRALAGINLKPPRITVRKHDGDQIVKYKDVTLV